MTVTAPSSLNPTRARPPTRPTGRLAARLVELTQALHHDEYQLVITAADIEPCTAREWIRIGRRLNDLPIIAAHLAAAARGRCWLNNTPSPWPCC